MPRRRRRAGRGQPHPGRPATLCLLNDERAAAGLHPLTVAQGLTQPSASYSARMVAESFFAHVAPDGATLTDRLEAGGYIDAGRRLDRRREHRLGPGRHLDGPRSIMIAWMNSPGHRENILSPEFSEVGIGDRPRHAPATRPGARPTRPTSAPSSTTPRRGRDHGLGRRQAAQGHHEGEGQGKSCKVKAASASGPRA